MALPLTEQVNPDTEDIDRCGTLAILQKINREDRRVAEAAEKCLEALVPAVEAAAERLARAQEVQAGILADILKGRVGQILPVRCDGPDFAEGAFFGRSYAEAPDIDPRIRLNWDRPIESGGLYRAEITGTDGRDMEANILEEMGGIPAPGKEVL